jgi:hypothetical protein
MAYSEKRKETKMRLSAGFLSHSLSREGEEEWTNGMASYSSPLSATPQKCIGKYGGRRKRVYTIERNGKNATKKDA